jgi:hypothetical protein
MAASQQKQGQARSAGLPLPRCRWTIPLIVRGEQVLVEGRFLYTDFQLAD